MTTPFPRQRLWQAAAALLVAVGLWMSVQRPKPPPATQETSSKRIAFCASVIDAIKPGDKTCGPYLQQARELLASQKQAAAAAAEAARPKAINLYGWFPSGFNGIYMRMCGPDCISSKAVEGHRYIVFEVWCKESPCGDIYMQVNLVDEKKVVVGWTNDTAYGDLGQKVQLTLQPMQDDWSTMQLTKLSMSGADMR